MLSRILDPRSILRVQSWTAVTSAPSAVDHITGVEWPSDVGTVATARVDVLCIGPTDWLVIGGDSDDGELCGKLRAALMGSPLRATDISRGLTRVGIEGPRVRDLLLEGCSIDLYPDHLSTQRCVRTRFAGVPTVVRYRDAATSELLVATSYREYLLAWIADATAST